jgi:hypothetical protein
MIVAIKHLYEMEPDNCVGSTLSILFEMSDQFPDILVAFRKFSTKTNHPRTFNTIRNSIEYILVTAAMKPNAIHQVWCVTRAGGTTMAISAAGTRVDQFSPPKCLRIILHGRCW